MRIGLVGLGRMGANMAERIRAGGHEVVGYDRDPDLGDVTSLQELVAQLPAPRVVWVMVPAGAPTHDTVATLADLLSPGDLVVDGGNSRWTDDLAHADGLRAEGAAAIDLAVGQHQHGRRLRRRTRTRHDSTPRSTSNTSLPPTNVITTRPVSCAPAHGELRDFEKPLVGS